MHILIWIISGILAGWLTGLIMKGKGYGIFGDLVVGTLGGVLGGWIFRQIGLSTTNWMGNVGVAIIGGVILVVILRVLRRA